MQYLRVLEKNVEGIFVAIVIGILSIAISDFSGLLILDPLVVAMTLGIILRSIFPFNDRIIYGFYVAPLVFIPIGVVLYGAVNLNFAEFQELGAGRVFMLFFVLIVYVVAVLMLSNWIGLREKERYLIATGSAICGASAITITSRAIDASSDTVSVSLLAVYIAALFALFVAVPFLYLFIHISELDQGVFYGTVLQFSGFVKAATGDLPAAVQKLALSVKATRYAALLFLIPLFSSLVKGRFHVPWFIWAFLGAGAVFSAFPSMAAILRPPLDFLLKLLWGIAMAAIGLNADIKTLFTKNGLKAIFVSVTSFIVVMLVFAVRFLL